MGFRADKDTETVPPYLAYSECDLIPVHSCVSMYAFITPVYTVPGYGVVWVLYCTVPYCNHHTVLRSSSTIHRMWGPTGTGPGQEIRVLSHMDANFRTIYKSVLPSH